MSGKPNGLAEKPGLLASLERVGGEFNQLRGELMSALAESQGRETAVELGGLTQEVKVTKLGALGQKQLWLLTGAAGVATFIGVIAALLDNLTPPTR